MQRVHPHRPAPVPLPVLVLQRQFSRGILAGSVKG